MKDGDRASLGFQPIFFTEGDEPQEDEIEDEEESTEELQEEGVGSEGVSQFSGLATNVTSDLVKHTVTAAKEKRPLLPRVTLHG